MSIKQLRRLREGVAFFNYFECTSSASVGSAPSTKEMLTHPFGNRVQMFPLIPHGSVLDPRSNELKSREILQGLVC